MRPTYAAGQDIRIRVAAQLLIPLAKDIAGEDDARVIACQLAQLRLVVLSIGRVAYYDAFHVAVQHPPRFDQMVGAVLRHQPPDKQHVALRLQSKARQRLARRAARQFCAVGDVG